MVQKVPQIYFKDFEFTYKIILKMTRNVAVRCTTTLLSSSEIQLIFVAHSFRKIMLCHRSFTLTLAYVTGMLSL